ncbi:hypothetical protein OKW29_000567 [Paraburkholderia sp. CI3]
MTSANWGYWLLAANYFCTCLVYVAFAMYH